MFKCSILSGVKLAKIDNNTLDKLSEYADNFGVMFQIYDDIIDCTLTTQQLGKTAGKDKNDNKLTYVSAYGIDKAKKIFYTLIENNRVILKELGIKSEILNLIYESLINKIN